MKIQIKYNKKTQKISLILKNNDTNHDQEFILTINDYLKLIKPIYEDLEEDIAHLDTELSKIAIASKIHEIMTKIAKKQHMMTDDKIQLSQPDCQVVNNKIMIKNFSYQKAEEISLGIAIKYLKYLESLKKENYLKIKDYSDFF